MLIRSDAQVFDFADAWAGIVVASVLGIALYLAVAVVRAAARALGPRAPLALGRRCANGPIVESW